MVHMNSAITTNLTLELPDEAIKSCSWVKVSINGGTAKTYEAVHQRDHFEKVTMNMHKAVAKRQELKSRCTLGAQLVLLPENKDSVEKLILAVKAIGFDYVVIKPYSQHLSSKTRKYNEINYNELGANYQQWESYSDGNFKVIVRARSMEAWDIKQRSYRKCWSMPFFGAYVAENGDIYSCSCYIGNPDFKLGNIYGKSFSKIWLDREKNYRHVRERLDVSKCRVNCHFDKINEYLERVINPRSHDNFL
jgi:radical SAM protein with 4Fe4S-binding SPASM domain